MKTPWLVYHGCRLVLGAVFLYAGVSKGLDVTGFAGDIAAYRILPYLGNYLLAATLPYIEIIAGALLLANRRVRPAALLCGLLTLVFIAALLSAWVRGLDISCGCFEPGAQTGIGEALLRDLALLVLAHFTFHLSNRCLPARKN
ncbi:methylamine utilization protein MauE [Geothermobacter ehrlichii]|uniref:Methylamine utilization protein MauE n=1 Tax=Geothermobacter ehrlichii TaxID=213224 RepID=A0A5D3WLH6_9BACT|nr:MauE/DoxX family redox-associated membrane protein [Geothermobacter ehrlichii]TYO98984.1 methylamine utilization protein MauE [Geothermobacter ehrlichii]